MDPARNLLLAESLLSVPFQTATSLVIHCIKKRGGGDALPSFIERIFNCISLMSVYDSQFNRVK